MAGYRETSGNFAVGRLLKLPLATTLIAYETALTLNDVTGNVFTDTQLMQRIASQDEQALSLLYERFSGPVYSLARRMVQNTAMAEEVTQDIFLKVWRQAEQWDPAKGKLISWMLTITRYTAIDRLRKEQRRPDLSAAPLDLVSGTLSVNARVDDSLWQDGQALRRLLGELPDDQREAIELAFFQGLTHTMIAEALSLPLGTVKTRVRLGLQKLRALWQEAHPYEENR